MSLNPYMEMDSAMSGCGLKAIYWNVGLSLRTHVDIISVSILAFVFIKFIMGMSQ